MRKVAEPKKMEGRDPNCGACGGTGFYESHHNGDVQTCSCRPPPKDPCPWREWSERSECRCLNCEVSMLRRILSHTRELKRPSAAIRRAIGAYDRRFGQG